MFDIFQWMVYAWFIANCVPWMLIYLKDNSIILLADHITTNQLSLYFLNWTHIWFSLPAVIHNSNCIGLFIRSIWQHGSIVLSVIGAQPKSNWYLRQVVIETSTAGKVENTGWRELQMIFILQIWKK